MTIEDNAFRSCWSLTSVTIPDSVKSIGYSAFENCSSLLSVTVGNSVTSIAGYAFYQCSSLTSVMMGKSVTSIGDSAFDYCDQLTDVYYAGSESDWYKISIGSWNGSLLNATIHFNSVSGDDDSITSIISNPAVVNHNYGVNTYDNTLAGDVYQDTRNFINPKVVK